MDFNELRKTNFEYINIDGLTIVGNILKGMQVLEATQIKNKKKFVIQLNDVKIQAEYFKTEIFKIGGETLDVLEFSDRLAELIFQDEEEKIRLLLYLNATSSSSYPSDFIMVFLQRINLKIAENLKNKTRNVQVLNLVQSGHTNMYRVRVKSSYGVKNYLVGLSVKRKYDCIFYNEISGERKEVQQNSSVYRLFLKSIEENIQQGELEHEQLYIGYEMEWGVPLIVNQLIEALYQETKEYKMKKLFKQI